MCKSADFDEIKIEVRQITSLSVSAKSADNNCRSFNLTSKGHPHEVMFRYICIGKCLQILTCLVKLFAFLSLFIVFVLFFFSTVFW